MNKKTTETRPPRQQICRGRRPRRPAPSTFRIALLFIPQTMTTTQRMVGANSVRPIRSPTQLHEKSKPRNSLETGGRISVSLRTEISPSPYNISGKFYRHKIAPLGLSLLHRNIILFKSVDNLLLI